MIVVVGVVLRWVELEQASPMRLCKCIFFIAQKHIAVPSQECPIKASQLENAATAASSIIVYRQVT